MERINLYDLSLDEMTTLVGEWGYSRFHARQIWQALYRDGVQSIESMTRVRAEIVARLQAVAILPQPLVQADVRSSDGYTRKFLLRPKSNPIETVIMQFKGRYTACVSSQAGCAMGCVFCATGQMGFTRHLSAGEIVAQVLHVKRELAAQGDKLRNIVLMGMGEPLHNYDNTLKAVDIITDHNGLAIAQKHITLSTVGLPAGIRRLADEGRSIRLAVSLHGANNADRHSLVPVAKKYTLEKVLDACRYYIEKRERRIFFEWALIAGENDRPAQARQLGRLLQAFDCTINVIPLNPTNGYIGLPSNTVAVAQFTQILRDEFGLRCTVRQRRGIDIAAGCGQLAVLATE